MITKTQTINWSPFSAKHKQYIRKALQTGMSVAEGAIRSGKTIDHCIIASAILEETPDKIHLASGSTIANAKLNIGDCNGFGLEYLFRGRCKWGKYKDNEALYINTKTGQKIVIFAGGSKADSYKKILGNSYGIWIGTEINEHYDSDDSRTSFIKVAMGRQVASQRPVILWDLNPCNPHAKIYSDYIDKWRENPPSSGYQYEHFTIRDNLSISDQRRKEIEDRYDPTSIWFRRDILGERCIADGLIYETFINNESDFMIDESEVPNLTYINIGQDFGGNKSKHTYCACGITDDNEIYVLASEEYDAKGTPVEFVVNHLQMFADKIRAKYGFVDYVFADSAEQTIINTERQKTDLHIRDAEKNQIIDRIRAENILFVSRHIHFVKGECDSTITALREAIWDKDADEDERLDQPGTTNICPLDAFEYAWEHYIYKITKTFNKEQEEE